VASGGNGAAERGHQGARCACMLANVLAGGGEGVYLRLNTCR